MCVFVLSLLYATQVVWKTHRLFFRNNAKCLELAVGQTGAPIEKCLNQLSSRRCSDVGSNKRHIQLCNNRSLQYYILLLLGRVHREALTFPNDCTCTPNRQSMVSKLAQSLLTLEEERDTPSCPTAATERLLPGATKAWQASGAAIANRSMLTHLVMMWVCVVLALVLLLIGCWAEALVTTA